MPDRFLASPDSPLDGATLGGQVADYITDRLMQPLHGEKTGQLHG